jgi:hypothetical protein
MGQAPQGVSHQPYTMQPAGLIEEKAPRLFDLYGVGVDTAASLLVLPVTIPNGEVRKDSGLTSVGPHPSQPAQGK